MNMSTISNSAYAVREAAFQLGALRQIAEAMIREEDRFIDFAAFANIVIAATISATVRLDACSRALAENGADSGQLDEYMDVNWPAPPEEDPPAVASQEGGAA